MNRTRVPLFRCTDDHVPEAFRAHHAKRGKCIWCGIKIGRRLKRPRKSNDCDTRVLLEMRAVEISEQINQVSVMTLSEFCGWEMHALDGDLPNRLTSYDEHEWWTGWLARAINRHGL